jgi:hypothetical protein
MGHYSNCVEVVAIRSGNQRKSSSPEFSGFSGARSNTNEDCTFPKVEAICQVFKQKYLTLCPLQPDTVEMNLPPPPRRVTGLVRKRIEQGGERLWRLEDFRDLPFAAVAQALSRFTRAGVIERLSKGVYYRSRQTVFGKSRPNPAAIQKLAGRQKTVFPSGVVAANLLGFTTQSVKNGEVATSAMSLPRKLIGQDTVIHTRRPEAWATLSETDAAFLDFLRHAGKWSELSPKETIDRTVALLSARGRFDRLLKVAASEPPRVRAVLGAIGQQIGKNPAALRRLRESLNPFSRFDFGMLAGLRHAREWQAKG